jgi:DNA repair protein RadA/Sms
MAVLEKRIGLPLSNYDAYVNIAGGIKMNEPAIDLGIIMALVSSYKNRAIDEKMIVFGEVGLSGEIRPVSQIERRVAEAEKLGFSTIFISKYNKPFSNGKKSKIKIIELSDIPSLVRNLFQQ